MNAKLARLLDILNQQADAIDNILSSRSEYKYKSIEKLLLVHGKCFTNRKLLPNKAKPNACYENSFQALIFHDDWEYCEGYFIYDKIGLAIPHAWLVDKEGYVIDLTLENDLEGAVYFGVTFNREFVFDMAQKLKMYGILDSDYMLGHQFKRYGFPEGAVINQPST